jgi:hypothetical protein
MLASLFPAITLTHGQHVDLDWPDFVGRYLSRHEVRNRKDGRLFSFAVYRNDPVRGDLNVRAMTGVVMDFDNKVGEGNDAQCSATPTLPEHHFDNLGDITYAWYSTHQNSGEWPRWRLVFPLDREVLPHEWPAVFDGAMALLARDENIDTSCGDLSRAYYTPSCAPACEAAAFAGFHEGRLCPVDELLSMTSVVIRDNVHTLPGVDQRHPGRNNRLKAIASAMLGRSQPVEAIILELLKVDAEHNPPLFTDRSEGFTGSAEAGALKFVGNIALSHSARSKQQGGAPDALYLRGLTESAYIPPAAGESLVILASDLPAALKPTQWLARHYIEANALSVLFGEPGAGKSFLALDLGLSIATGTQWHQQRVRQTPVVYLCGEGWGGLQRRMHAWGDWHQVDWRASPFALTKRAIPLSNRQAVEALKRDLDAIIERLGDAPGLFIVDTLARNFGGGDENSTKDMSLFIDHVGAYLMDAYKAAVMLVHHTGHGDKQRARGSSSLKGAVDAEYFVTKGQTGLVELSGLKMKDAPLPETLYFAMRAVDLGVRDEEGEALTSVVPLAVASPAETTLKPAPSRERAPAQGQVLDLLRELYARNKANLKASGFDPSGARVPVDEWRNEAIERRLVSTRQNFFRLKSALVEQGAVFIENGVARLLEPEASMDSVNE